MFDPTKFRPPQVVLVLLVLAGLVQFIIKPARLIGTSRWGGLFVAIFGFCLMFWARQLFEKNKTPVRHSETPKNLVMEGPYQFTRNPMYVGGLIMFTGIGIFVGTWPFLMIPVVLFFILNTVYIPFEEKTMAGLFKDDYEEYKEKVRRWL